MYSTSAPTASPQVVTYESNSHGDTYLIVSVSLILGIVAGLWALTSRILHERAKLQSDISELEHDLIDSRNAADKASMHNRYMLMLSHKDNQSFRAHIIKRIDEIEEELRELRSNLESPTDQE